MSSLGFSCGIAFLFVFWIYWDPAFGDVLDTLRDNYWWWFSSDGWAEDSLLGVRLIVFAFLALCASCSALFIVVALCFGRPQDSSLKSLFFLIAVAAVWLLLFIRYDDLDWLAFQGRVRRAIPTLKKDVALLRADPSTVSGTLPYSGSYEYDHSFPIEGRSRCLWIVEPDDLSLTRHHDGRPIECITEWKDGSIRFATRYEGRTRGGCFIEFRPDGSLPHPKYPDQPPEYCIQLEPGWFLIYWIFADS